MKICLSLVIALMTLFNLLAQQPLNVILVMTDDQGYCDIAAHGHPYLRTPHLDRLSSESVRLGDFHVSPFCTPTRSALMTGRFSNRTGATATYGEYNYLRRNETTMAEYFKASGYATGIFGKWHIGDNYPYRPIDRGFDEWLGLGNGGLALADDFWGNDRMNDIYWHNGVPEKRDGFSTDIYFEATMKYAKSCLSRKQPFFIYLATNVPHYDNNVPESWLTPYIEQKCDLISAGFYASVERFDWNMGRLMDFMQREGLRENTLLVYLTDNGTCCPLLEKGGVNRVTGRRGAKGSLYEGGHRVPCFLWGSEQVIGKSRDVAGLTSHIDLLPTFIDLCALRRPQRGLLPLDGRTLKPLLQGMGRWPDRVLFKNSQNGIAPVKHTRGLVMTEDWRLVMNGPEKYELYRITADPSQQSDIAKQHPAVLTRLLEEYERYWSTLDRESPRERPLVSSIAELFLASGWQKNVRAGKRHQGRWYVEVEEPGRYSFEVRRWPREVTEPMTAGLPPAEDPDIVYIGGSCGGTPGKPLQIKSVSLSLSGYDKIEHRVEKGAQGVSFEIDLRRGALDIHAEYLMEDGNRMGAYYLYITRE